MLLSGLNSNLSFGDRIEPKSCCFGFPHEEGVPLFHKSWCCASSKAASCDSATCPPLQAEIWTRSRSAAPPRAFWPPCLGAANSSSPLESSAATTGKGCCGSAEIRLRPPFENYPTRRISPLRGPGVHADSDPKSGVPDQGCQEGFQAGSFATVRPPNRSICNWWIALGRTGDDRSVGPGKHSPRTARDAPDSSGERPSGSGISDPRIGTGLSGSCWVCIGRLADGMRSEDIAVGLGRTQRAFGIDGFSDGMAAPVAGRT